MTVEEKLLGSRVLALPVCYNLLNSLLARGIRFSLGDSMAVRGPYFFLVSLLAIDCQAISFLSFDASSMALGGAGAATGLSGDRIYLNPAVTAGGRPLYTFNTYVGARLIDREHFIDTFSEVEDTYDALHLENKIKRIQLSLNHGITDTVTLRDLANTANQLVTEINKLPNRYLRIGAAMGVQVLAKQHYFAVGAFARQYRVMSGVVQNDPKDIQQITQLAAMANDLANTVDNVNQLQTLVSAVDWDAIEELLKLSVQAGAIDERLRNYESLEGVQPLLDSLDQLQGNLQQLDRHVDLRALANFIVNDNSELLADDILIDDIHLGNVNVRQFLRYPIPERLNSQIIFTGADVRETALNFNLLPAKLPGFAVGINLKDVSYSTIAYIQRIDEFDLDEYLQEHSRKEYQFWNVDIGATYAIDHHWTVGGVIKNVFAKTLKNNLGDSVVIEPIVRTGIAYQTAYFGLAVDMDLTKNEPLGFDVDKQYFSVGGELHIWRRNALRAGYRYNRVDQSGMPALGLRLGFASGEVDLAVTYSTKELEAGLAIQLGMQF